VHARTVPASAAGIARRSALGADEIIDALMEALPSGRTEE
jgi:hypothetical protein